MSGAAAAVLALATCGSRCVSRNMSFWVLHFFCVLDFCVLDFFCVLYFLCWTSSVHCTSSVRIVLTMKGYDLR